MERNGYFCPVVGPFGGNLAPLLDTTTFDGVPHMAAEGHRFVYMTAPLQQKEHQQSPSGAVGQMNFLAAPMYAPQHGSLQGYAGMASQLGDGRHVSTPPAAPVGSMMTIGFAPGSCSAAAGSAIHRVDSNQGEAFGGCVMVPRQANQPLPASWPANPLDAIAGHQGSPPLSSAPGAPPSYVVVQLAPPAQQRQPLPHPQQSAGQYPMYYTTPPPPGDSPAQPHYAQVQMPDGGQVGAGEAVEGGVWQSIMHLGGVGQMAAPLGPQTPPPHAQSVLQSSMQQLIYTINAAPESAQLQAMTAPQPFQFIQPQQLPQTHSPNLPPQYAPSYWLPVPTLQSQPASYGAVPAAQHHHHVERRTAVAPHSQRQHPSKPAPVDPNRPLGVRGFLAPLPLGSRDVPGAPVITTLPPLAMPIPEWGRLPVPVTTKAS